MTIPEIDQHNWQVPFFRLQEFAPRRTKYCVCVPVINEGERIAKQLAQMKKKAIPEVADILIADGGSADGSLGKKMLNEAGVRALLVKEGPGRLSAQLRMGYAYALQEGYQGIVTIDGNNKDNVEAIVDFIVALDEGYDMVQGSRYLRGGEAINTPVLRKLAVKFIHIPIISLLARFRYTDTTNGFRAYSLDVLIDQQVQPFRDIFSTYELLAYLSVKVPRLGYKVKEIPVKRVYPEQGKIPTKISFLKGNIGLLIILLWLGLGKFDPS